MVTYFLLHDNSVHIILFNLKKIKENYIGQKKKIWVKACKKTILWNTNYDHENKDYTNALIYVHVVLNGVIFPQISYAIIVPYARHLLPVRFFPKY